MISKPKSIETTTIRLLDEDIQIIVEGLNTTTEEKHTPLVVRIEQAINRS